MPRLSLLSAPSAAAILAFTSFAAAAQPSSAMSGACQQLAGLKLPDTRITSAQTVEPGFVAPASLIMGAAKMSKGFCRMRGVIAPAITFELWLPLKGAWNGRFQGVGSGGMSGEINFHGLMRGLETDFATASTDLGHEGHSFDARFAIRDPGKVVDWGYRSTHEMTVKAKAIVAAFYGSAPRYSYFNGCSGGGRQGMMEAQRFPDDYDGILAGDPTIDFTNLTTGGRLWVSLATLRDANGAAYIPAAKVPRIAAAVLAACDSLDGIVDGVLDDPRQCRFDPSSIQCRAGDAADCLTPPQVAAMRKIYAGAKTASGEQIYPGYEPGGELGAFGWGLQITGKARLESTQWQYASGFLKGMIFEDLAYDPMTFDFETDMASVNGKLILGEPLPKAINAADPNLAAFRARGGKLVMYHGWSDAGVAPKRSIDYYESVLADPHVAKSDGQDFIRLYMIPGGHHCSGGPGPNSFGGLFQPPVPADPDHDIFKALQRWVESGKAPERIVATKYADDDPARGVDRTRPLCPYPKVAKFAGAGNTDEAASFTCQLPLS